MDPQVLDAQHVDGYGSNQAGTKQYWHKAIQDTRGWLPHHMYGSNP